MFYSHVVSNRGQWREDEVWFSHMGATIREHHSLRWQKKVSSSATAFFEIVDQAAFYCVVTSVKSFSNQVYWFIFPKEAAVTWNLWNVVEILLTVSQVVPKRQHDSVKNVKHCYYGFLAVFVFSVLYRVANM